MALPASDCTRSPKTLLLFLVALWLLLGPALAGSLLAAAAPTPPLRQIQVLRGDYFLRLLPAEKAVEIISNETLDIFWRAKIEDYSPDFSIFRSSEDGEYLFHLRDNPLIHDLDQECLTVYGRSGFRGHYFVREFRDTLAPGEPGSGAQFRWFAGETNPIPQQLGAELYIKLDPYRAVHVSYVDHHLKFLDFTPTAATPVPVPPVPVSRTVTPVSPAATPVPPAAAPRAVAGSLLAGLDPVTVRAWGIAICAGLVLAYLIRRGWFTSAR